nr:hypothetical protein [Tanacetum cinerariifolium]
MNSGTLLEFQRTLTVRIRLCFRRLPHDPCFDWFFDEVSLLLIWISSNGIARVLSDRHFFSLNTNLDLNNLLSCLMDDLWASELTIFNFSPADRIKGCDALLGAKDGMKDWDEDFLFLSHNKHKTQAS